LLRHGSAHLRFEQYRNRHAQGPREPWNVCWAERSIAVLDQADVLPTDSGASGDLMLGEFLSAAKATEVGGSNSTHEIGSFHPNIGRPARLLLQPNCTTGGM